MEKNKHNENGKAHGYWEEDYDDTLYCGFYEHGEEVGIWRIYEDGILIKIYFVGDDPYWNVYSQREMVEYVSDFEYIHKHHYE